MKQEYENCRTSKPIFEEVERVHSIFEKLTEANPSFLKKREGLFFYDFFDSIIRYRGISWAPVGPQEHAVEVDVWRPKKKKRKQLDFIVTLKL